MNYFAYGGRSVSRLETCHPALQEIADEALARSPYDITIIHGLRGKEAQNTLYASNASTKMWPNSRHNKSNDDVIIDPHAYSDALDFAPWVNNTIYWNDTHIFAVIAGCFFAAASAVGYKIRWGGDWDMDGQSTDQRLMDWGHIELNWK